MSVLACNKEDIKHVHVKAIMISVRETPFPYSLNTTNPSKYYFKTFYDSFLYWTASKINVQNDGCAVKGKTNSDF